LEKAGLEEIEEITTLHLKKEPDIMEMVFKIDDSEAKEFYKWYVNHPTRKGIGKIKEFVRGTKTNRAT
jgi:hypothetical protein